MLFPVIATIAMQLILLHTMWMRLNAHDTFGGDMTWYADVRRDFGLFVSMMAAMMAVCLAGHYGYV